MEEEEKEERRTAHEWALDYLHDLVYESVLESKQATLLPALGAKELIRAALRSRH